MEQVLHGSARTMPAVRRAIQASSDSLVKLAARYGIAPKTVAKWRARPSVADAPMGPTNPVSTGLSPLEEAACVAFRQRTLLPLDDCIYALQEMRLSIWDDSPARALGPAPPLSAARHQPAARRRGR